ncbi:MAG: hypothetical protein IKA36_06185, partial [Clostridia bacterium]|nr:hypothetical protein [Clostridia bacterium]
MDRYLAKPTRIIGENGVVKTIDDVSCNLDHSSGTSNCECSKNSYRINAYDQTTHSNGVKTLTKNYPLSISKRSLDNTIILINPEFDYVSEVIDNHAGCIGEAINIANDAKTIINDAKSVADEAKTTANIAHTTASGLSDRIDYAESTALKAQEKATEAYNSYHSVNTSYESLKARVEDLEATDGQASVPIVGTSKMGYVSDFTEYVEGGSYYVQATWKDGESRSLLFGKDTNLGDVLEELMYTTATGLSTIHERVTTLEERPTSGESQGGDSTSTTHGNCLEQELTFQPYAQLSDEAMELMGIPAENKSMTQTLEAADALTDACTMVTAVMGEVMVNRSKITTLENTTTSHTNSIQSLDTRTTSHGASIGQLENRMTDVALQSQTNKNSLFELDGRVAAIESGSTSSGSNPINISTIATANDMYGNLAFKQDEPCATYDVNYAIQHVNDNAMVLKSVCEHLLNKFTSLKSAVVTDLNYIWDTLRSKYPDLPEIGTGGGATTWATSSV